MHHRVFRIPLYPKPEQERKLRFQVDACRCTYNDLVEYCRYQLELYRGWKDVQDGDFAGKPYDHSDGTDLKPVFPSEFELVTKAGEFRDINLWRRDAYSASVRETGRRVHKAFSRFFETAGTDRPAGLPRFRSEPTYNSYTYPQYNMYRFDTEGLFKGKRARVYLGGVGWVRYADTGNLQKYMYPELMKQAVVKRRKMSNKCRWELIVTVELPENPQTKCMILGEDAPEPAGIDIGARKTAVVSDGTVVENPRSYRKNEKKLARIQRKIACTEKSSPERRKYLGHMNHCLCHLRNGMDDLLHKATRFIVKNHLTIYVEDVNIRKLMDLQDNKEKRKLFRDASVGKFMRLLRYKGEESGSEIVEVNSAYTSRYCCNCGAMNDPGSSEIYHCNTCGLVIDRDLNACVNILRRGMGFDIRGPSLWPESLRRKPRYAKTPKNRRVFTHTI